MCVRIGWCADRIKLVWNVSKLNIHVFLGSLKCKIAMGKMTAGCIVRGSFLPCARRALFSSRSRIFIS